MKRSEIKVGDELYWARGADWRCPVYSGSPTGYRATVVDTAPVKINKFEWGLRGPDWSPDPKGTAVVVDVERPGSGTNRQAVPLATLRGEWVETYAAVEAALAERREAREMEFRRRELVLDRAAWVAARADRAGYVAHVHGDGEVRMPADELSRLLDRAGAS